MAGACYICPESARSIRMANLSREAVFREMYEEHWHHVYAYAYNILLDQAKAEDIVQDIFINVWNRFEGLDIREPRAYLFKAVRFQCAKHFRSQKFSHVQLDAVIDILHKHEFDFSLEETEELIAQIDSKADSLLPEKCRQIFKLRFHQQLSNKEIAEQLGISVSTVENQINKAIKLLRFSLNQQALVVLIITGLSQG